MPQAELETAPPANDAPALEPGLHRDVPMDVYLALPYVSASGLARLRRSPLHYRQWLSEPRAPTPAIERGTALHLALLEPDAFDARYRVAGPCEARMKSGQRAGEACGAPGQMRHLIYGWQCGRHLNGLPTDYDTSFELLSEADHAAVIGMRDAILAHPRARTLFEGRGEFEVTIIFDDPETGVRCKTRPDRLIERARMLVDLKSTRDAREWCFARDAEQRAYWLQLALYRRALRAVGWPYQQAAIVAVESAPPYDLVPYLIQEGDIDSADREVSRLLRVYRECTETDTWPGYTTEFAELRRPAWATNDLEEAAA